MAKGKFRSAIVQPGLKGLNMGSSSIQFLFILSAFDLISHTSVYRGKRNQDT